MPRTQVQKEDIKNNELTGASFVSGMKIYNETANYSINDETQWAGTIWRALVAITGGAEGDLTNAPDVSSDWEQVTGIAFAVYPTTVQTFADTGTIVQYDSIRYDNPAFSLNTTTGEVTVNTGGNYIVEVTQTNKDASGNRNTSWTYIQIDKNDSFGFVDIPNFKVSGYHRNGNDGETTGNSGLPISLNTNDKLRVFTKSRLSYNLDTVPGGCNFLLWAPNGTRGPQGPQGIAGQDGSGSTINIQDSGTNIPNTPHSVLNFEGDLTVTDAGSGTANINVNPTKQKYMVPIWAEENAALADDTYEWAFGNGANTSANNGISIFIPSGYQCNIKGLSLNLNAGSATVEIIINGASISRDIYGDASTNKSPTVEFSTAYLLNNSDRLNFRTVTTSGTSGSNTICAWLEYTEQ